jgi:alanine racemase
MFSWIRNLRERHRKPLETLNTIRISREAVLWNFDSYRALCPGYAIFPVLKSNAYGHGIRQIASILKERNPTYFVVDAYHEALAAHEASGIRSLLMGFVPLANFASMDFSIVTPVVWNLSALEILGQTGKRISVHMKIDTGMHRQGMLPGEVPGFLSILRKYPNISLEGICTHLSDADSVATDRTVAQIELFRSVVEGVRREGFDPKYVHAENTAGGVKSDASAASGFNAMRLGIGLYGINPLKMGDPFYGRLSGLRPALRFESTLTVRKDVEEGGRVGYGGKFAAPVKTYIGVVPVGYYEGIPRLLGEGAFNYTWDGRHFPIVGTVCMNMTMVDLGNAKIQPGEKVTVISDDPKAPNSVYAMAKAADTIPYECLTGLAESIRRVVE